MGVCEAPIDGLTSASLLTRCYHQFHYSISQHGPMMSQRLVSGSSSSGKYSFGSQPTKFGRQRPGLVHRVPALSLQIDRPHHEVIFESI